MKRRALIYSLIFGLLLIATLLNPSAFSQPGLEELNNLEGYRTGLIHINEKYAEDYDSRIIVKTKLKLDDENCIYKTSGFNGLNVLQYGNTEDAENALSYYSSLDTVEYAVKDSKVSINSLSDNQTIAIKLNGTKHLSWGANLLGIDEYQEYLQKIYKDKHMPEVYVAVLDTGIDTDSVFLNGRIAYEYGISYYNSTTKSKYSFEDDNSHGTHVSGTIVDLTLENVKIIPIKVLNHEGSGPNSNIISAMEYLISLKNDKGLNIVAGNMSLGSVGTTQNEIDAISNLYDNNIMPVVAAGNDNYYVEEYGPANIEKALTISALQKNTGKYNNLHISYYSNYGKYIDLCLPGSKILSCVPQNTRYTNVITYSENKYAELNGTSMATPHATALVALYATFYGYNYDVQTVENQIKQNTYDYGDAGRDDLYGYGIPCMTLAIKSDELNATPTLNYGGVFETYNFENSLQLEITDNNKSGFNHKIYYTTDGTVPTLISYKKYTNSITISESTLIRFVIYSFDNFGKFAGRSDLYEATFFKGQSTLNDDGTGFEINAKGVVTKYNSGLREIVMPEYINNIKVKKLDSGLFEGQNITSFTCEQDIEIGANPFIYCGQLKYIKLNSSKADRIAYACFSLQELILPNITSLQESFINIIYYGMVNGSHTFEKCFNLKTIYAPKVNSVKDYTFSLQKRLENLTLDWDNIIELGEYSFESCENLELSLTLADSLTEIPCGCFEESKINSITANGVTKINSWAFYKCKNLKNVSFARLSEIQKFGFASSGIVGGISLAEDCVIEDSAFSLCEELKEIDLSTCKTIGEDAFSHCKSLKNVSLISCESLSKGAFAGCSQLESVTLSPAITEIPEECFEFCSSLKEFDFSNIKYIYDRAFQFCGLTEIILSDTAELKSNYEIDSTKRGQHFRYCSALTNVVLGNSTTIIPNSCFDFCSNLKTIDLSKVKEIEGRAFCYCNSILDINLENAEKIGEDAFKGTNKNAKVIFGNNKNLIQSNDNIDMGANSIYISKNYAGIIGDFIKNNYSYVYSDLDENYNVYCNYQYYTLTLKFKDGTIIDELKLPSKSSVTLPNIFENSTGRYEILSWKSNLNNNAYYSIISLKSDTVLTADYVIRINTVKFYYNMDFDKSGNVNDDGDLFETITVRSGIQVKLDGTINNYSTPSADYTFVGWEYNGVVYSPDKLPKANGDMNFYAVFNAKTKKYKVSWYGFDNEFLYSETVEYGATPSFKVSRVIIKDVLNWNFKLSKIKEYWDYYFTKWGKLEKVTQNVSYYAGK